jgi:purine-binding chemotaxis protein CheW
MMALGKPREEIDWAAVRKRMAAAIQATEAAMNPSPERAQQIMKERARISTALRRAEPAAGDMVDMVTFRLPSAGLYGIETRYVCGVITRKCFTTIPRTPAHLVGIHDLHGQMLPIFDLRSLMGLPADVVAVNPQALVCGEEDAEFGILADEVTNVGRLHLPQLTTLPESDFSGNVSWIRGTDKDGMTVLDGAALLKDPRLFIE